MTETRILTRSVIEEYKNAKYQLTTDLVRVYQCPSTCKAAAVTLIQLANIDTINDGFATVGWSDYSDLDFITYLLPNGNLPARSGLSVLHRTMFLEPLDAIWAKADALNRMHMTLSILEIS